MRRAEIRFSAFDGEVLRLAGVAVFDIIGTCFSLDRPRRALTGLGAPAGLFDIWFAQSLRDFFAYSHSGGYAPLKDVLQAALTRTLTKAGIRHSVEDVQSVMATFAELEPRPEFPEAVEHLRSHGWRLMALTNGAEQSTRKLLEVARVAGSFGEVISCDAIGVAKPNPAVYRLAAERSGGAELWMIAAHAWDIAGASRAGMRTAFITEVEGEYLGVYPQPDITADNLMAAARKIAP